MRIWTTSGAAAWCARRTNRKQGNAWAPASLLLKPAADKRSTLTEIPNCSRTQNAALPRFVLIPPNLPLTAKN